MSARLLPSHKDILDRMENRDAELDQRLASGERRFSAIEDQLSNIISLLEPLPQMKADIAKTKEDVSETKEIMVAYSTVKNVGRFIKWVAPIFAAIVAAVVTIKALAAAFTDCGHRP